MQERKKNPSAFLRNIFQILNVLSFTIPLESITGRDYRMGTDGERIRDKGSSEILVHGVTAIFQAQEVQFFRASGRFV